MKYTFADVGSDIKNVEIYTAGKELHAKVLFPEGLDTAKAEKIKTSLAQRGFSLVADFEDGQHLLQVRGFGSAENLLSNMAADGAVKGDYAVKITDREKEQKKEGPSALVKAGAFYLGADIVLGAGEYMRARETGKMDGVIGAVAWAIPSVLLMVAGQQSPDVVNGFVTRDIQKQLNDLRIAVPEDVQKALAAAAADDSMWPRLVQTVYEHAPKINNALQVYGGIKMSTAGGQQLNFGKQLAGMFVALGMGLGLVLDEPHKTNVPASDLGHGELINPLHRVQPSSKKTASDEKEKEFFISPERKAEGFFADVTPLWFSGNLAKLNNYLNIAGAVNELSVWSRGKTWLGQEEDVLNPYTRGEAVHSLEARSNALGTLETQFEASKTQLEFVKAQQTLNDPAFSASALELAQRRHDAHEKDFGEASKKFREDDISAKAAWCNLVASGLYLAANGYYAHSSKENTADIEKVGGVSTMLALIANTIAVHPLEDQAALKEQLSMMLAENKHIGMGLKEVSAKLGEKVEALNHSPWLGKETAPEELVKRDMGEALPLANNAVPFTRKSTLSQTPVPYIHESEVPTRLMEQGHSVVMV
jgi:hypothetical protein